jgi:hypothetical protein
MLSTDTCCTLYSETPLPSTKTGGVPPESTDFRDFSRIQSVKNGRCQPFHPHTRQWRRQCSVKQLTASPGAVRAA